MDASCAITGTSFMGFASAQSSKGRTASLAETDAETYVERYSDMILRLSLTYLGGSADAEDICQDVLIKLMTQAPKFADVEHEKAWVLRTAINRCKDVLKSARYRTSVPLDDTVPHPATQSAAAEALSHNDDMLAAISRLTEDQRECVFLFYYEDLKIDDIAKIMGKSPNAVAKHLSRARQTLREMLGRSQND